MIGFRILGTQADWQISHHHYSASKVTKVAYVADAMPSGGDLAATVGAKRRGRDHRVKRCRRSPYCNSNRHARRPD
jgi:hypothetical protein